MVIFNCALKHRSAKTCRNSKCFVRHLSTARRGPQLISSDYKHLEIHELLAAIHLLSDEYSLEKRFRMNVLAVVTQNDIAFGLNPLEMLSNYAGGRMN